MMGINNFLFKSSQIRKTALDKAYNKHIKTIINNLNEENEGRWETYNIIIEELINQGKGNYFEEMKYRLTDGEDPNKIILDIIEREVDEINGLIWILKRRIEDYIEDDYIKRFYQ
jgi:hypothetical protein